MARDNRPVTAPPRRGKVDWAKVDATSEAEIERQAIEDDEAPETEAGAETVVPVRFVREKLGMTQDEFSAATGIPVATLRNWEQERTKPDPAARALMAILLKIPKPALKALEGRKRG